MRAKIVVETELAIDSSTDSAVDFDLDERDYVVKVMIGDKAEADGGDASINQFELTVDLSDFSASTDSALSGLVPLAMSALVTGALALAF